MTRIDGQALRKVQLRIPEGDFLASRSEFIKLSLNGHQILVIDSEDRVKFVLGTTSQSLFPLEDEAEPDASSSASDESTSWLR